MLLGMLAMERIMRTESARFMNGTGTAQPTGAEVAFAVVADPPDFKFDISEDAYTLSGTDARTPWADFIDVKKAVNAA